MSLGHVLDASGATVPFRYDYEWPLAVESRRARFDAAADMPADITATANVTSKIITFSGFSATASKVRVRFHLGTNSWNAVAGAGPICMGALVTINAPDLSTAITRLTYTDLTGGGTSSSGVVDTFMVSPDAAELLITFPSGTYLTNVYAIGIPIGVTPTNIVPSFLSISSFG